MNPKLQKYIAQRERNANRITALQDQNAKLDKKITELQNLELHGLLRGANMTYQDLTAYIEAKAGLSVLLEKEQEGVTNDEKE